MHVRTLAAMMSGYLSVHQCVQLGLVRGERRAVERLNGLFEGATPAMVDQF